MSGPATLMRPEPLGGFGQVHLAAAGFLARYSGGTRTAYALDLRSFFAWCADRGMPVFEVTRPHLDIYGRWMEERRGYAPATIARRIATVAGFYRFVVIDGLLNANAGGQPARSVNCRPEPGSPVLVRLVVGSTLPASMKSARSLAAIRTYRPILQKRIRR